MVSEVRNIDKLDKVLIGLSGGINSMAVLCWLSEQEEKPHELHLFYAHFAQHSPDTLKFVEDGVNFAKANFPNVIYYSTQNNINKFWIENKMIAHPMLSPCTRKLKIEPINAYAFANDIKIDLVGYVKEELIRRASGQKKAKSDLFGLEKRYPIGNFTNEWCFEIVDKYIGWHPAIYDIRDEKGKRVFKHNNCLPCKNMTTKDLENVKAYYPAYFEDAMKTAEEINSFYGRSKDDFYSKFGRDLGQDSTCEYCKF